MKIEISIPSVDKIVRKIINYFSNNFINIMYKSKRRIDFKKINRNNMVFAKWIEEVGKTEYSKLVVKISNLSVDKESSFFSDKYNIYYGRVDKKILVGSISYDALFKKYYDFEIDEHNLVISILDKLNIIIESNGLIVTKEGGNNLVIGRLSSVHYDPNEKMMTLYIVGGQFVKMSMIRFEDSISFIIDVFKNYI